MKKLGIKQKIGDRLGHLFKKDDSKENKKKARKAKREEKRQSKQKKKQEKKEKKKPKKKKRKPTKVKVKYKTPRDVKLSYIMPSSLFLAGTIIFVGLFTIHLNNTAYEERILASSMPKGSDLPIWEGDSSGNLALGNTVLSADGKTLAVEVRYDDEAHESLSSFGENYNLYLIDTDENKMSGTQMNYGMFGTDGSGVLTIHREQGFADKAFMVFLLDKGQIVSSDELNVDGSLSDEEIDRSLASQLAEIEASDSEDEEREHDRRLPPTYMIRLNAHSSETANRNWSNDRELVEDLFVDRNIKRIEERKNDMQKQIEKGEETLEEMNQRLEENPNDNTAENSKRDLENQIESLQGEISKADDNIESIKEENIERNALSPKQSDYYNYTVRDINDVTP